MTTKHFGVHPDTKEPLTLTTVTSKPNGIIEVAFTNVGAAIVSWKIGRIAGKQELVLGFHDGARYLAHPNDNPFFGATIGRIANRIAHARIKDLNEQDYQLSPTEGENVCHSGPEGFHHRLFNGPILDHDGDKQTITYNLYVEHLEDNFPGSVKVFVKYTVEEEEKLGGVIAGKVGIEYDVRLVGDAEETAVAMTNHSYFNITDGPTIAGTAVQLHSATKQDVDDAKIPTGTTSLHPKVRLFTASTPLSITLGETEPVFDDCFILPDVPEPTIDTRHFPLSDFAHLFNETSQINLLVSTTEPAVQFYTGDGIHVRGDGEHKPSFGPRAGLCLEAGRPINAVNDPVAKKWVILKKGEIYGSYTTYTTWLSS